MIAWVATLNQNDILKWVNDKWGLLVKNKMASIEAPFDHIMKPQLAPLLAYKHQNAESKKAYCKQKSGMQLHQHIAW